MKRCNLFPRFLVVTLLSLTALFSCSGDSEEDSVQPTISILSPAPNSFSISGENLNIRALVQDNSLHEVKLDISRIKDGTNLFSKTYVAHDKSTFTLSETWLVPLLSDPNEDVNIKVTALDHGDHEVNQSVVLTVLPK